MPDLSVKRKARKGSARGSYKKEGERTDNPPVHLPQLRHYAITARGQACGGGYRVMKYKAEY